MRTLFISYVLPAPALDGASLYSGELARLFQSISEAFTFLGPGQPLAQDRGVRTVEEFFNHAARVELSLRPSHARYANYVMSREPYFASQLGTAENNRTLDSILRNERPDVVVFDHLASSWAFEQARVFRESQAPQMKLVYCAHNSETATRRMIAKSAALPAAIGHVFDVARVRSRESTMLRHSDLVTTICDADMKSLRNTFGSTNMLVIMPSYRGTVVDASASCISERDRRVCIGNSYTWSAKVINLRQFLHLAERSLADSGIQLDVVGQMAPKLRDELSRAHPTVNVVGAVEDMQPYLLRSRAGLLIDKVGGGFKMSLLTYAFSRTPILGLTSAVHDNDALDAGIFVRSYESLVAAIVANIDDIPLLESLQSRAFRYFESRHLAPQLLEKSARDLSEILHAN